MIRAGFGRNAEDDRLYALGWPYLAHLEPGDAKPKELAGGASFFKKYPLVPGPVPAGAAPRMLRGLETMLTDEARTMTAISNAAPLSEEERDQLFDKMITEWFGFVGTFLLEALFSTRVVLSALVDRIERLPPEQWSNGMFESFGGACVRALHFLLLRSEPAHAGEIRERLVRLHKGPGQSGQSGRAAKQLDIAINGREGVERSGGRMNGVLHLDVMFAIDDLDYVRRKSLEFIPKLRSADRSEISARLGYLGGDEVMEAIAGNMKGVHSAHREALAVGLSRSAHPSVHAIMSALNTPTAKRWLKAQG